MSNRVVPLSKPIISFANSILAEYPPAWGAHAENLKSPAALMSMTASSKGIPNLPLNKRAKLQETASIASSGVLK